MTANIVMKTGLTVKLILKALTPSSYLGNLSYTFWIKRLTFRLYIMASIPIMTGIVV
jgi:hypothetical protein